MGRRGRRSVLVVLGRRNVCREKGLPDVEGRNDADP